MIWNGKRGQSIINKRTLRSVMNRKAKGISGEREIVHLFHKYNWSSIRVAGSGSSKYPSPDVLAGNGFRVVAIECKVTKGKSIYIPKTEIELLNMFASNFGAESWVGAKFGSGDWYFIPTHDLDETASSVVITLEKAKQKGFVFEELIG